MEHIVGATNPKQWWQYKAESMTDLAEFFEQLARNQDQLVKSARTQKQKRDHQSQANAYRDVGKILRETLIEPYGLTKMLEEHDDNEVASALWANWLTLSRLDIVQEQTP
jgi:hypothetical protein